MDNAHIIIIGGGFAGAFAAKQIRKRLPKSVSIELINCTNYFVFQPLLPEVVAGTLRASDTVTPLRLMLPNVKVRMAEVFNINFETQLVHIVQGSKRIPQKIAYDHLVLAMGQQANLSFLQGFEEHSFALKNIADAYALRSHILQQLEHADITENPKLKKRLLTFVIAGAGFSGVETIGEMMEMMDKTLKYYPNISKNELNCILIDRGERILPELTQKLSEYAHKKLISRGVSILLKTSINSMTAKSVFLDNGECIQTGTLVSTVGNGPTDLTKSLDLNLKWGKIQTDTHLRVNDTKNIWALGDAAVIPFDKQKYAPPTAQFAVREAVCLAKNIRATIKGQSLHSFFYKPKGQMASIGNHKAVAEMLGVRISGLFAWLLWRTFYIGMMPTLAGKIRIAFSWTLDLIVRRNIVQIYNENHHATCRYAYYAKGDVLFRPGQLIDGFYTVVSGKLESRTVSDSGNFVRVLHPGDHWGERTINHNYETVSTLTALEETKVLILGREIFTKLQQSLPLFNESLDSIDEDNYPQPLRKE